MEGEEPGEQRRKNLLGSTMLQPRGFLKERKKKAKKNRQTGRTKP